MNKIRSVKERSKSTDILFFILVILSGLALGYISKKYDGKNIIGHFTSGFALWVFISALIAAYSRKPFLAAVNVMSFFLAMLCAYYLYGQIMLGFFPKAYAIGWLSIALVSTVYGFVVWFSKGEGILSVIPSAIPISLLFALGYPAFYTYKTELLISLALGVVLNIILPNNKRKKIAVFLCSAAMAFFMAKYNILSYLPF